MRLLNRYTKFKLAGRDSAVCVQRNFTAIPWRCAWAYWKRTTALGALAGILVGVGTAIVLVFSKHDPFFGLNAGFVALCLNLLVTIVVSLLTVPAPHSFEDPAVSAFAAAGSETQRHGS